MARCVATRRIRERSFRATDRAAHASIETRDWLMSAGKPWMVSEKSGARYFLPVESPPMTRFFAAVYRYKKSVQPQTSESYSIVARILPHPQMFVRNGAAIGGFEVEPLAVSAGDGLFVDLGAAAGTVAPFAGEEDLASVVLPMPPDEATPTEVVNAFFHCLKVGEEDEWRSFFAT